MPQVKEVTIMEIAQGAILEKLDHEMGKVMKNVLDPNAQAKKARTITVKLTLTPNEERETVEVKANVTSTLAPTSPVVTTLFVDEREGKPVAVEFTKQIPGQLDVGGATQQENKIIKLA